MSKEIECYLNEIVKPYLREDDDPKFWSVALCKILEDIELMDIEKNNKQDIFLQIGACSHWFRPHQTRLAEAGGFAAPDGYLGGKYGGGLPEFDWFIILHRSETEKQWLLVDKFFNKRKLVCRIVLPTRTVKHNQAAINIFWFPGTPKFPSTKRALFYGFRQLNGIWSFVASALLKYF